MPKESRLQLEAKAQALYMQALIKKAMQQAEADVAAVNIDPQGRCLIDVELDREDLIAILDKINPELKVYDRPTLEQALGRTFSPVTTVSLDVTQSEPLSLHYSRELAKKLGDNDIPEPEAYGSVIALQQEFHFHLSLAGRLYKKELKKEIKDYDEVQEKIGLLAEAQKETLKLVNDLVLAKYAEGLKKAKEQNGSVNIAKLNKVLDQGRADILPIAHQLFKEQIEKHVKITFSKLNVKDLTHAGEETTASPNDVIHTDHNQGLVTFIAGSEETAHSRKLGTEFAHRQLITAVLAKDGSVQPTENPKVQIRTPSPVVKNENYSRVEPQGNKTSRTITEDEFVADVATKFAHLNNEYHLADKVQVPQGKAKVAPIGAFIYNSYTSINQLYNDGGSNKQTQSAHHILKGAHQYNAAQLASQEKPVFCFVQNISVNGFGDNLRSSNYFSASSFGNGILNFIRDLPSRVGNFFGNIYRAIRGQPTQPFVGRDTLVKETTLMAELAMMHTIYEQAYADKYEKGTIDGIFEAYKNYLKDPERPAYFCQSHEGKRVRESIDSLKNDWEGKSVLNRDKFNERNDFTAQVKFCIKRMMAENLHYDHEYSKIFQTLSVFAEQVSVSGCKSANERTQAINGRVAVLEKAMANPEQYPQIVKCINQIAVSGLNIKLKADELNNTLNAEYNRAGLQGGSSLVSLLDQGAAAKLEKQDSGPTFNTNKAEHQDMFNLQQSKAGKMQYHKGVVKYMVNAWKPDKALEAQVEQSVVFSATVVDKADINGSHRKILNELGVTGTKATEHSLTSDEKHDYDYDDEDGLERTTLIRKDPEPVVTETEEEHHSVSQHGSGSFTIH